MPGPISYTVEIEFSRELQPKRNDHKIQMHAGKGVLHSNVQNKSCLYVVGSLSIIWHLV